MIEIKEIVKGFNTAESRWSRFGPYYAMFPVDFAFEVVEKYSKPGDFIIDPFAGRSSSIFAGGVLGRHSLGIEINPVGWLYGSVKLNPADKNDVIDRLLDIYSKRNDFTYDLEKMPLFFRMCYCDEVLKFLLSVRYHLDWQNDNIDATLMAIILVYLHGKLGEGLSNQMKMTKAMGINYSIKWWKRNNLVNPPEINPLDFLVKKIEWRYKKGLPEVYDSRVIFGDSTIELSKIAKRAIENDIRFSLLFTSPPYYSITDYHTDQWLRLWLLGGQDKPKSNSQEFKNRFNNKENYIKLLDAVFGSCVKLMNDKSTIYVRTDKREFTFRNTLNILKKHFPDYNFQIINKPVMKKTQTDVLGNRSKEKGEIDIILMR